MFYEQTVLDNGVTVVSERMEGVRSVALGFWLRVGNRDESHKELGMSHFMEHMLFKGTPTRSAAEISMAFDSIGADLNAFTSREYTCFYARMIDEYLGCGFEILSDMLVNASFEEDAIRPEREVVIEEIAQAQDQPDDFVYDLLAQAMYGSHPLGLPVLGNRESVSSFTQADMRSYHSKNYVSGNLIVVACGSVKHAELVELAKRYLDGISCAEKRIRTFEPLAKRKRLINETKDTEQAHILIGYPSVSMHDERKYAHSLLDLAMGGSMSSRLFQEVREKRGLVYSIYTSTNMYEDYGTFCMYAGTRVENVTQVIELARIEFERAAEKGFDAAELDRVIELACGNFVLSMESPRTHMIRLGRNLTCNTPVKSLDETLESYRGVSTQDISDAAFGLFDTFGSIAVVSTLKETELKDMLV